MKHVLFFKRILALLLSVILLFTLCACEQREGGASTETPPIDSSDENTSPASSEISSESAAPADPAALNAIKAVLLGNAEFFETNENEYMDIQQFYDLYRQEPGDTPIEFRQFAIVDMDADGTPEVILSLYIEGGLQPIGYEILHNINGIVYGYSVTFRGFRDLKADGTFSFSSGADNSGFGTGKFTENDMIIDRITYNESGHDSSGNYTVSYFVDDEKASEEEFVSAWEKQEEKPDATWYDFTDDNIEKMFP